MFALNKFSTLKVFLALKTKRCHEGQCHVNTEGGGAQRLFHLRMSCTIGALCDDALSCKNLTLTKPAAGLRLVKFSTNIFTLSIAT